MMKSTNSLNMGLLITEHLSIPKRLQGWVNIIFTKPGIRNHFYLYRNDFIDNTENSFLCK